MRSVSNRKAALRNWRPRWRRSEPFRLAAVIEPRVSSLEFVCVRGVRTVVCTLLAVAL